MLRENNIKWLIEERNSREKGIQKQRLMPDEDQRLRRLRKSAPKIIKYLTVLLETLPEKELVEIFDVENMQPFLSSLLSLQSDNKEKRRERVISLWNAVFSAGSGEDYGLKLVGKDVWHALTLREERGLQAIYYATLYPKQGREDSS